MDRRRHRRRARLDGAPLGQSGDVAPIRTLGALCNVYRERRRLRGDRDAGRLGCQRTFVFVGVLGGFTTFSSFGLDTFTLGHGGDHAAALWNVVGQVGLGLGGVWLGFYLGL